VNFISLPTLLTDAQLAVLNQEIGKWTTLQVELHVLDFRATKTVSSSTLKVLHKFAAHVLASNKNLISAYMSESIFSAVKLLGLEEKFNRIAKFPDDLQKKRTLGELELRTLLLKYLAQAAKVAVEVSLHSSVQFDEQNLIKAEQLPLEQFEVIATISVYTDFLKAEFRLCCKIDVLEKLAGAMMGKEIQLDSALIEGMALELLNIIYGHAKSNLNDKESFRLPSAIPRLLRAGEYHRSKRSADTQQIKILTMTTPMGAFYIEVDFKS
jgi:anti-anti-sigma regulatory factor/CheY-specific phosphatase CheX